MNSQKKIVVSITNDNNTQKGQMLSDDAKNLSVRQTIQTYTERRDSIEKSVEKEWGRHNDAVESTPSASESIASAKKAD